MNSRNKGAEGERALAAELRRHGFEDARRGCQYKGGADSPDVIGIPGIHIECKRVERLNLTEAYAQSYRDSAPGEIATVMHKKNREPWMVTLTLDDFVTILRGSTWKN